MTADEWATLIDDATAAGLTIYAITEDRPVTLPSGAVVGPLPPAVSYRPGAAGGDASSVTFSTGTLLLIGLAVYLLLR